MLNLFFCYVRFSTKVLNHRATTHQFSCRSLGSSSPAAFHSFRGTPEPLDSPPGAFNQEPLVTSVRRAISSIRHHPWTPVEGDNAVSVRGFIYNVDTGQSQEATA
ncbi:MAG: hypothetical protein EBR00_09550 [Gammaproteobacteria bacterium]|nr:hypothetical protein [Gammaproteobacteria bacterium]